MNRMELVVFQGRGSVVEMSGERVVWGDLVGSYLEVLGYVREGEGMRERELSEREMSE